MAENDKLIAVISLVAGIAIGANWDKIKETLAPLISSFTEQASKVTEKGTKFFAEQKEKVEDTIAAAKIASAKKSLQAQEPVSTEKRNSHSKKIIVKRKKPSQVKAESIATATPA